MKDVIVITGAGQGLGECIAKALISNGFRVAITDINEEKAVELAKKLDTDGNTAVGFKLDVTKKQDFEQVLANVEARFGQVNGLVNNAALTLMTSVMDVTAEEFDQVININLRGTLFGCQVFGAYLAEKGYGRIVNMASLAGQNGGAAASVHYAASKGGILTMTKVFASNLAAQGVTVNAVAPGPIDLPIVYELVPPEKLQHLLENVIPVKALASPSFIGNIVAQLLQRDAFGVTGATWDINGGLFMR
ncbi:SDR family oxidoreductase [Psychrobacter frigidicola]|uniref:SDR family oxidoreductase n=1 Tax=Psychrobacter frigidicola TaxID=45611 RepID=A0A5C7A6S0_9GAMM|nr:SDR family NAD(P)-dependent oxidoreductase [Psychrobacter frigidicola]TXD98360.1 SDR family oxidoreductase [Psychrobacter frigidicola]